MVKITFDEKICENILLLTVDKKFINDVFKIRDEFDIPYKNYLYLESLEFLIAIEKLRKKYKLPGVYKYYLKIFILAGYLNPYPNIDYPFSDILFLDKVKDKSGEEHLSIRLDPETTLKDIQMAWSKIEKEREKLIGYTPTRQNKRRNLRRDLYILTLKNQGKSYKKIQDEIYEKYGVKIEYQQVYKIIKRLKEAKNKLYPYKKT